MQVLYGLQSLFATPDAVSPSHWYDYCENLAIRQRLPSIQALHYARRDPTAAPAASLHSVWPDLTVTPYEYTDAAVLPVLPMSSDLQSMPQELYVPQYLWSWEDSVPAYELDVFAGSERRGLIEQARDTGWPVASARVAFMDNTGQMVPGFIVYLPVYRWGRPPLTVAQRRLGIQGMLAVVFRLPNLFAEILHRTAAGDRRGVVG
jgi:hypothetical protein